MYNIIMKMNRLLPMGLLALMWTEWTTLPGTAMDVVCTTNLVGGITTTCILDCDVCVHMSVCM